MNRRTLITRFFKNLGVVAPYDVILKIGFSLIVANCWAL